MKITEFQGEYRFLSNFWFCNIRFGLSTWPSAEHLFQAMKTLVFAEQEMILNAPTPGKAKRLGKQVTMRPDWETIKIDIMYQIVLAKFTQNKKLKQSLLGTGDAELIEGNQHGDRFWGVCDGVGENNLGIILMKVRHVLRNTE